MEECKNCKYYIGNCGHHHKDSNKHINYDCPAEYMCEEGIITCFKPSDIYIETINLKNAERIAKEYSFEVIERALEIKKGENNTMEQKGTLLICDRCDKKEFFNKDLTLLPHFKTVPLKTKYEGNALLCEDCYKKYSKMIDDFWKVVKVDEG